ncbi:adhesin [Actinoplanes palleronii]|nr:adhesin [Actinoplanes palleronii]
MRATVGPLPPAVYWRRRVVVLGALLLGIIVWFVACSHGDDDKPNTKNASSQLPTPEPGKSSASASPTPDDGLLDSAPPGGQAYPDPDPVKSSAAPDPGDLLQTTAPGVNTDVNAAGNACTDAEMQVTPVPGATKVKRGVPLAITLTIKNIGTRTCTRDVGADPQELYLEQGVQKYWSSDKCNPTKGSDVATFAPGAEKTFNVTWNGRQSTACSGAAPAGPAPAAGEYQLRGRLDGIISAPPVVVTITS